MKVPPAPEPHKKFILLCHHTKSSRPRGVEIQAEKWFNGAATSPGPTPLQNIHFSSQIKPEGRIGNVFSALPFEPHLYLPTRILYHMSDHKSVMFSNQ
jgi:hypothetical protein